MQWGRGLVVLGATGAILVACGGAAVSVSNTKGGTDDDPIHPSSQTPPREAGAPLSTQADSGAAQSGTDLDKDGLDDAQERTWAKFYFPYFSISPSDACPTNGVLFRVHPHPDDTTKIHIVYDVLYDRDCGTGGHNGDNEVFGMTVDPSKQGAAGVRAIRAIGHQATFCQRTSACGACIGEPCMTMKRSNGEDWPAVWSSRNKHANYVNANTKCSFLGTCFDQCDDALIPLSPEMVNAGEPNAPLITNLTTQGFVTAANGWQSQELFNFNPWSQAAFGGAGVLGDDLNDPAFLTPTCE